MTPEQARENAEQIQREIISEKVVGTITVQELRRYIARALLNAVAEERERAAQIADHFTGTLWTEEEVSVARIIASAIRKDET